MFRDASVASADTKVLKEIDESVFCMESIKGYRNIFRTLHINHVWDSLDNIDFLRKIGAVGLSTETGKLHPTATGLLMFGYEYEIIREFLQYFLDYQEKFDSKILGQIELFQVPANGAKMSLTFSSRQRPS